MLGGFVALVLVTGACSDGGDSKDERDKEEASGTREDYVDAFKPGVAAMGVTDEQAKCVAEAAVDTVGVDNLNKVTSPREVKGQTGSFDMTAFNLTEEEGGALYDKIDACVDVFDLVVGQTPDPALADCLRQNVTDGMLRSAMVPLFMGGDTASGDAAVALTNAYNDCQSQVSPTSLPTP